MMMNSVVKAAIRAGNSVIVFCLTDARI
jgi:hypothetical protein